MFEIQLLEIMYVHTVPKNGTLASFAKAAPPPLENTFVHSFRKENG